MGRWSENQSVLRPAFLIVGLFAIYLFLNVSGDLLPGSNWSTINEGLIQLWGYFVVLAIALFAFKEILGRN